jgi:hypothetical protein
MAPRAHVEKITNSLVPSTLTDDMGDETIQSCDDLSVMCDHPGCRKLPRVQVSIVLQQMHRFFTDHRRT